MLRPRAPRSNGGFLNNCSFDAQSVCGNPISFYAVPQDAGSLNSTLLSVVIPMSLSGIGPFAWPASISNPDAYYGAAPPAFTVRRRPDRSCCVECENPPSLAPFGRIS